MIGDELQLFPSNPQLWRTFTFSDTIGKCGGGTLSPINLKKEINDMQIITIADKLRNLTKDEDQLLLEKHGLVNPDGTLTVDGEDVIMDRMFAAVKADIVADLKKLEKSEEKKS